MPDKPIGAFSPEIEKLSEKLQKDPNSKLFFNLAEEYYKGGLVEEASAVLQAGLKIHPTYLSAKVLLGKIYADQSKTKEAREIFEQVLKVNPDNIIVNKRLALIYFNEKLMNNARKCCDQVLFFSSKDPDALTLLQKIKESEKAPERLPVELKIAEENPAPAIQPSLGPEAGPAVEELKIEEQVKEDQSAISGAALLPVPGSEVVAQAIQSVPIEQEPISNVEIASPPKAFPENLEVKTPETKVPAEPEKAFDFSDIMKEEIKPPASSSRPPSQNGMVKSKENLETMALAELYIKQGHYDKGIEIYQNLFDQDPYNETVRQQLEDAKTIGHLLGAKSQARKIEKNILETIIPAVEEINHSSPDPPPADLSPKNQAKIARLKQWLETIKKVH
jgi:tetratricopeptide (TPR) repeat protein